MRSDRIGKSVAAVLLAVSAVSARADVLTDHPAGQALTRIFATPAPANFKPTGINRGDYLKLMAADIDYFKGLQDASGAIIDPISHGERQYSTPAFAAAAGLLAKEAGRSDLLDPASRALTHSLTALLEKNAADKHSDFYMPLMMHAYRALKDVVSPEQAEKWAAQFKQVDPETMYRADLRSINWNLVSDGGELLRRQEGLVAPDRRDAQMQYLEKYLAGHIHVMKPAGLYEDPNAPMAYDAFSRLWLDDALSSGAYDGKYRQQFETFLRTGGLSTLLMLSPSGEWPNGGRSAMHQWTDLEVAAICEMEAGYWNKTGRDDIAGAFKRAAHLAFQSAARWQRPSGELWIIKNHGEPADRFAYEQYSNHSQYNLLPMAMLAIAYGHANESIQERPAPSEVGGYVFDLRDTFHKIFAAAGGYYVEIDTSADPHYNATGLQRVHRAGVPFPSLTDTASINRGYGQAKAPKVALALGAQWKAENGVFSLGQFVLHNNPQTVASADLKTQSEDARQTQFSVTYHLSGDAASRTVTEQYTVSPDGVEQTSHVSGIDNGLQIRVPVLLNDGAKDLDTKVDGDTVNISRQGSTTTIQVMNATSPLNLTGPKLITHAGWEQAAVADVKGDSAVVRVTLSQK